MIFFSVNMETVPPLLVDCVAPSISAREGPPVVDQLRPTWAGQLMAVRGEICWPAAGRSRGRTRGALLAAYGDSGVAAVNVAASVQLGEARELGEVAGEKAAEVRELARSP